MAIGYIILNEENENNLFICGNGNRVYRDRLSAEREARQLRKEFKSNDINVYELAEPGIIYVLSEDDIYDVAKEKRISRKRIEPKMEAIRSLVENGFYNWHDIVEDAIETAIKD